MTKHIIFFFSTLLILGSCSSSKKAQKSIESGDFDNAFNIAIEKLNEDKFKKSNQKLIPSLKTSFDKSNERDIQKIKILKNSTRLEDLKETYALYVGMDVRQDEVIALLPLSYDGKEISFKTIDYTNKIKTSLTNYSKALYSIAKKQLAGSKLEARKAYNNFNELEFVNPNYVDNVSELITESKIKGSSLVLLKINNKIKKVTTSEQLDELTRVSESNMNDPWVMYHFKKDNKMVYDYEAEISLNSFEISPEQVNSETYPQQARIKDGWEYVYDSAGNVMKDSLGNDIKRDKIITVQAEVKLFQQLKTGKIEGGIIITNLKTKTTISNDPLLGEAKFENVYGLFHGDQRAIEEKYYKALQNKEAPFPADSEFVKYCLANMRISMLQILDQQHF